MNNEKICLQALLANGKHHEQSGVKLTYMLVVKASGGEEGVVEAQGNSR